MTNTNLEQMCTDLLSALEYLLFLLPELKGKIPTCT